MFGQGAISEMQSSGLAIEDIDLASVCRRLPDGQIKKRFGPRLRGHASKKLQNAVRAETNFTSRFNVIWVVQMGRKK
jgi:hypothetical protein